MTQLTIDLETYCPVDLTRAGPYKYTEHPDFRILLFAYAVDDEEVKVVDLAKEESIKVYRKRFYRHSQIPW